MSTSCIEDPGDNSDSVIELEESPRSSKVDNYVFEDRIAIFVEPTSETFGGTQMCPAIFVPNNAAISTAVKHIYSRLSASAAVLDQGIPNVLISMVSSNTVLSADAKVKISSGLGRIVGHCGLWLITSGEQNDSLAALCSSIVKSSLTNIDNSEETLIIAVNSSDVAYRSQSSLSRRKAIAMADTSVNTYYFVMNQQKLSQKQKLEFRAQTAVKFANPPPALLIGVPVEPSAASLAQTPTGAVSPAIILPNSVKHDCRPLPVALFCSTLLASVFELRTYLECGVPVVVIQDASDLCALLRTCQIFYRSANFCHENFVLWLQSELRTIMAEETDVEFTPQEASVVICQCLAVAMGDHCLLSFITTDELDRLPEHIVELFMRSASSNEEYRQTLSLAVKLNVPSVIRNVRVANLFNDDQFEGILVSALCRDSRINVVDALMDNHSHLHVSPQLLMRLLDASADVDFFHTVVVGQCLGYSERLQTFAEEFANELNDLLVELSGGFTNLFPVDYFTQPNVSKDRAKTAQILSFWALFLNRPELVKCIWAHSPEPLPLALILARVSRSLALEAHEFFFYEEKLLDLSNWMTKAAYTLLDQAYKSAPRPTYQTLCRPLHNFNNLTLSTLAFETNSKEFISHECCQRWVLRQFYGNLQIDELLNWVIPKWLKIVLSALLVLPIRLFASVRPPIFEYSHAIPELTQTQKQMSPTVALLESGRPTRRIRASSTHSMYSARSYALNRDETSAPSRDERSTFSAAQTAIPLGIETPRSVMTSGLHVVNETEMDSLMQNEKTKPSAPRNFPDYANRKRVLKKSNQPATLGEFYTTPIVKYWLSLVFRVAYLLFMAYSVSLPGCGNVNYDLILLGWTLMWLIESLWVIHRRTRHMKLSHMPWALFDIVVVSLFFTVLITLEVRGRYLNSFAPFFSAYSVKVIWACLLLYQCYATLFIYIPLSELLGPLMVRVKLMVLRDFMYFLILVALLVISSAIAVKAIVYPDKPANFEEVKNALSWAWLSLFTTDLSGIHQTKECKASLLPRRSLDYCASIGGLANHNCPSDGPASYWMIIEYLIVLKLIAWPLLFALFAKTAKEIDDEAQQIWRYQLYGLATDMSLRPFLPPPLTPLFFIGICCSRRLTFTSTDHPDVHRSFRKFDSSPSSPGKYSVVYQNPSVPSQKHDPTKYFYCQAALDFWRNVNTVTETTINRKLNSLSKELREKLQHLIISSNFGNLAQQNAKREAWFEGYDETSRRVHVNDDYRSWNILLPDYCPSTYSKPTVEFPVEVQKFVDHTTAHHLAELCKQWRQRKLHDLLIGDKTSHLRLSTTGLPLNPSGRTGLIGRGNLVKFGPNNVQFYVIIARPKDQLCVLVSAASEDLPNKSRYDYNRADDFLSCILINAGVPDSSAQILSTKGHLTVGQVDNNVAHVCTKLLPSSDDTDNAWTEADVWAINLTAPSDYRILPQVLTAEFTWSPISKRLAKAESRKFVEDALSVFGIA
uniref:ANK_REP_REGION domain-containing protein n=1 Tax=Panagrellus redivivus TaxID=6233 RepID=A0A7E4VG07_PANRE